MAMSAARTPTQNGIDPEIEVKVVALRLSPEQHELFQRAAEYHGQSLEDFMVSAAMTVAEDVFDGPHSPGIQLSPAAYVKLLAYLDNPGEPNERLREGSRRYDEMLATGRLVEGSMRMGTFSRDHDSR
jgi:uncharacterized protein (DUF1778 family)